MSDQQRLWEDLAVGQALAPLSFPLTTYRLVVAAAGNRDFNPIHHNAAFARSTGAPDMYANNIFLQGMWERSVRDFIGLHGRIRRLSGFRMRSFNVVGDTVVVRGEVARLWRDDQAEGWVDIRIWSENSQGVSVGPGNILATLPTGARPPSKA